MKLPFGARSRRPRCRAVRVALGHDPVCGTDPHRRSQRSDRPRRRSQRDGPHRSLRHRRPNARLEIAHRTTQHDRRPINPDRTRPNDLHTTRQNSPLRPTKPAATHPPSPSARSNRQPTYPITSQYVAPGVPPYAGNEAFAIIADPQVGDAVVTVIGLSGRSGVIGEGVESGRSGASLAASFDVRPLAARRRRLRTVATIHRCL